MTNNKKTGRAVKGLSSTMKKAVTTLAKKAIKKEEETKLGYASVSLTGTCGIGKVLNVIYSVGLTQGTSAVSSQLIGTKFDLRRVNLRGTLSSVNDYTQLITIALIQADVYSTSSTLSNDYYLPAYNQEVYPPRFDSRKCRVLARKQFTIPQSNISGGASSRSVAVNMSVPINKVRTLSTDPTSVYDLKGGNYYWVMYLQSVGNVYGTASTTLSGVQEIFYKDA